VKKNSGSVFREHQTGPDTSENPLQIKVPQKGSPEQLTNKKMEPCFIGFFLTTNIKENTDDSITFCKAMEDEYFSSDMT